jgi:hypothetical protein
MISYVVSAIPTTLTAKSIFVDFARGANTQTSSRTGMRFKLDGGQKPFKFVKSQLQFRSSHGHVAINLKNTLNIVQ